MHERHSGTAPGRGTTSAAYWDDEQMAASLHVIVEALRDVVGFRAVGINVVRGDQLVRVATAGPPRVQDDQGRWVDLVDTVGDVQPLAPMQDVLARARPVGRWRYHRLEDIGMIRGWQASEPGGEWEPEDMLIAPVYDAAGRLRAVVSVDGPPGGRFPGEETRRLLDHYGARAARVVLAAVEHEELAEQVRLLEAARMLVSDVAATASVDEAVQQAGPMLREAFQVAGMRVAIFEPEYAIGLGRVPDLAATGRPAEHIAKRRAAAEALWQAQQVAILSRSEVVNFALPDPQSVIQELVVGHGLESMMLVPIGVADRCLGALALYRPPGAPHWSEHERRVARDVGRDLGRLLANAQALEREHRLVEQLRELEVYKRTLIATISHELKTPLAGILANAEFLAEAESAADIRHSAAAMARGAHRMTQLVEELLLIARLDDPGRTVAAGPVDLGAVAEEAVELQRPTAERSGVTIVVSFDDAVVVGNPEELLTMVDNLVGNAVKYSNRGGRVDLSIRRTDGTVCLEVADHGIGVSEADRLRIFGEFQRGTDPAVLSRPGSGLGLAIVDRIVRSHAGRVELDSSPGVGSRFRVYLPAG